MIATPSADAVDRVVLTQTLEDYLESIHMLVREGTVARVRDIAKARGVKTGSVIPALRRLRDAGLIDYRQREYVSLTPTGEEAARRVYSRHQVLSRFFRDVLHMPPELADQDACAMEHGLSDEGMDRLVRLFEFLGACPNGEPGFLEAFHRCSLAQDSPNLAAHCTKACHEHRHRPTDTPSQGEHDDSSLQPIKRVSELEPGQSGTVTQVRARGGVRQRLLDMGVLPDAPVEMIRVAPAGDPIWIRLEGSQLALRQSEAEAILVKRS